MKYRNGAKSATMTEVRHGFHEGKIRVDVQVTPADGFSGMFGSFEEGLAWLNDRFLGEWKVA